MATLVAIDTVKFPDEAVIDGDTRPVSERFAMIGPGDGRVLAHVAACDRHEVDRAVASPRTALEDGRWRDQPPKAKKKLLYALADLVTAHAEELALLDCLDTGKPTSDARIA